MNKYKTILSSLAMVGFATGMLAAANEVNKPTPESTALDETFRKSLIWFCETNGLRLALYPPAPPSTEVTIYAQSVGTNGYWRWIAPTNEVKYKVQVLNEQGIQLAPTNKTVEAACRFPLKVLLADYPKTQRRWSSRRYLPLWSRGVVPVGDFELGKYFDLTLGGSISVTITPFLYDSQPEPDFGRLTEFPSVTFKLSLPSREASLNAAPTNSPAK